MSLFLLVVFLAQASPSENEAELRDISNLTALMNELVEWTVQRSNWVERNTNTLSLIASQFDEHPDPDCYIEDIREKRFRFGYSETISAFQDSTGALALVWGPVANLEVIESGWYLNRANWKLTPMSHKERRSFVGQRGSSPSVISFLYERGADYLARFPEGLCTPGTLHVHVDWADASGAVHLLVENGIGTIVEPTIAQSPPYRVEGF